MDILNTVLLREIGLLKQNAFTKIIKKQNKRIINKIIYVIQYSFLRLVFYCETSPSVVNHCENVLD